VLAAQAQLLTLAPAWRSQVGTWRDFAKKKGKKVRACVLPARVRARRVLPSAQADSTRVCLQLHQRAFEHVSSVLDRFVGAGDAHAPVGTCSVLVRRHPVWNTPGQRSGWGGARRART